MKQEHDTLPPNVLRALEALETATTAGELGQAYQTVLDWRRRSPRRAPWREIDSGSDYWQGAFTGAFAVMLVFGVGDIFTKRTKPTLPHRVDLAIDRWRHLTPLMHEIPK